LGKLLLAEGAPFVPPGAGDFNLPAIFGGVTKPMVLVVLSVVIILTFFLVASRNLKIVPGRFQFAASDLPQQHTGRRSVLYTASRVEPFKFGEYPCAEPGHQLREFDKRRLADGREDSSQRLIIHCALSRARWLAGGMNTAPTKAKCAGLYMICTLSKDAAMANGYAEAIALGHDGMLSEGSGQNVFLVRDGTLFTPPVDGTLLPGITRRSLITLAEDLGIPVKEVPLPRETLYVADEVFLCGTAAEVTPVRSVDKIPVGAGKPGPVTLKLQKKFLDTVKGATADTHGWLTVVKAERASAKPARR